MTDVGLKCGVWWRNFATGKSDAEYVLYDGDRPTGFTASVGMVKLGDYNIEVYFEFERNVHNIDLLIFKKFYEDRVLEQVLTELKDKYAVWLLDVQTTIEGAKALIDENIYDYMARRSRELEHENGWQSLDPWWVRENNEETEKDKDGDE